MTDWSWFRAQFPALERMTWVNAAACSPLPLPVHAAARRHLDELLESADRQLEAWLAGVARARAALARAIGGAPEEVGFTPSTSHSMNVVASILRDAGVREVVTLATEFPSTTLPLLHHGLQLRFVEPVGGRYDLERIEAAVRPGVGAIVASHVQFGLGCAVDLEALGRIARDRRVLLAINATQSLGQRPADVGAAGAHFLAATGHKWMCAGFGAGMLWVRRELLDAHRLPFAGWLSTVDPGAMDNRALALRREASAVEVGTPAFEAPLRLGAALELLGQVGFAAIHERIVALTDLLRAGMRRLRIEPLTPDDPAIRTGITSFAAPDATAQVAALAARGIFASARQGAVRLSLHAYNDEADVERTLQGLEQVR